jgi:4-hydroxy-tetrahydrodipicolinate synthase
MVALVTPMDGEGRIDEEALSRLVAWHVEQGTHGIVPCGTTGESATLNHAEHHRVVEIVVEAAAGRVSVLAGSGSNSTEEAIELSRHAKRAGADGVLLITPYYNKPNQDGLVAHFTALSEAVDIPQVLYNVPSRTAVNMLPETVARLAHLENVVAIKEATGSIQTSGEIRRLCGDSIDIISGDDFSNLGLLAMGAVGAISVTGNIIPGPMAAMFNAWEAGDLAEARRLHYDMLPLHLAMFMDTSPIPVKTATAMMGLTGPGMRMPLIPLSEDKSADLRELLTARGLVREQMA